MTIQVKVTRKSGQSNKQIMNRVRKDSIEAAAKSIEYGVILIESEAKKGISSISPGRTETRRNADSGTTRTVTVSKPGDAPNTDTGIALSSVGFNVKRGLFETVGIVGTWLVYLAALEFKWKGRAARPWLRPAVKKTKGSIDRNIKKQLIRAARKDGIN